MLGIVASSVKKAVRRGALRRDLNQYVRGGCCSLAAEKLQKARDEKMFESVEDFVIGGQIKVGGIPSLMVISEFGSIITSRIRIVSMNST